MFSNYKLINNVLYLYVDDKCEIGSFYSDEKEFLLSKVKRYIKDMKINFNGTKVVLLLSGLMLGTIFLNNMESNKSYDVYKGKEYVYNIVDTYYPTVDKKVYDKISEVLENVDTLKYSYDCPADVKENVIIREKHTESTNKQIQNESFLSLNNNEQASLIVTINRSNGEVLKLALEDYLVGVVAAEMPAFFNVEALKVQAVIARTYTKKLINSGRKITDDVTTQAYKSDDELKRMWGNNYNMYYNKIKKAVLSTKEKYLTYNGELIDAVYHSTSNGYTEDASFVWGNSVPYLKIVTSPWDTSASTFQRNVDVSFEELSNKLGINFDEESVIEIISRDDSGRISKIKIGNKELTGTLARNLIGLRSSDFDITINTSSVTFTTRGYGHGVGMSQYGANGMANSGYTYEQILKHYYYGVIITDFK